LEIRRGEEEAHNARLRKEGQTVVVQKKVDTLLMEQVASPEES
jgi:hypothetical protein